MMRVVHKIRRLTYPARMRLSEALYRALYGWPAPPRARPADEQPFLAVTQALSARWAQYRAASVDTTISERDDMFVAGELDHYLWVGTSALEVISEAMLLARKTAFHSLLDMPCGYGRVTRHLVKFFPDSKLFVSEIDKAKQAFCATTFGGREIDLPADFSGEPARHFDLIFVGSLLTHLDENQSIDAIRYLLKALSEGGLLIMTTQGRYATSQAANLGYMRHDTLRSFMRRGFGYEARAGGDNRTAAAAAWVLRILESMPDVRVLGHKEQGWSLHQDVFVVEKATGWTWARPLKSRWPLLG
jgi:SAM-dependent methyltransferase